MYPHGLVKLLSGQIKSWAYILEKYTSPMGGGNLWDMVFGPLYRHTIIISEAIK
jgi:hypothetical protein